MKYLTIILSILFWNLILQLTVFGEESNHAESVLKNDPIYKKFSCNQEIKTFSDDELSPGLFCYIRHNRLSIYIAIIKVEDQKFHLTHSSTYQTGANEISCITKMRSAKFLGIAWFDEKESILQYLRIATKSGEISSETLKVERRNFAFYMSQNGDLKAIYAIDGKVHVVDLTKGNESKFNIAGLIPNSPCHLAMLGDTMYLFTCLYAKKQGGVDYASFEIWESKLNGSRQIIDQNKIGEGKLGPWGPPKGMFSIEKTETKSKLVLKTGSMDELQSVTAQVELHDAAK